MNQRVGPALRSPRAPSSIADAVTQTQVSNDRRERAGLRGQDVSHDGRARALEALKPRNHQQHTRRGHANNLEVAEEARHDVGRETRHLDVVQPGMHKEQEQRVGHEAVAPVQRGDFRFVSLVDVHRG